MPAQPVIAFSVGRCPACQADITAEATVELEIDAAMSGPDPRQEGKVTLNGKITGATIMSHDCRKKVPR